jgi:hypothetical protein
VPAPAGANVATEAPTQRVIVVAVELPGADIPLEDDLAEAL